jgi:hypothetical protein
MIETLTAPRTRRKYKPRTGKGRPPNDRRLLRSDSLRPCNLLDIEVKTLARIFERIK